MVVAVVVVGGPLATLVSFFFPQQQAVASQGERETPASDKRKEEGRGLDCGAKLKATLGCGGGGGDSGGGGGGIDGPSRHVLVRYVFCSRLLPFCVLFPGMVHAS